MKLNETEELREIGYKIIDYFIDAYSCEDRRLFTSQIIQDSKKFDIDFPKNGSSAEKIISESIEMIGEGKCNVLSPYYFGYITPRPTPISILGDFISNIDNQTSGAWRAGPTATEIESCSIKWLCEFIEYYQTKSKTPSGIITSGGSAANLMGIDLARNNGYKKYGKEIDKVSKFNYYYCENAHMSISKSLKLLGVSQKNQRKIESNRDYQMDLKLLKDTIEMDLIKGYIPIGIIGTYGTTTIGAIDDLQGIRDISDKYGTWFHLDAASGGVYGKILSNKYGSLKLADSITVDPSKWFFMSYGVGSLLVKNSDLLKELYGTNSSYWMEDDKHDNFQMSFNGTRSWRTLGLYLSFKYYGSERYTSVVNNMISVARYLSGKLQELGMDLICGSELPILLFRPKNYKNNQVEKLCEILIQEDIAYVTTAELEKKTYIRVAISNYLTNFRHIDEFISGLKNKI
ncbi:MAG: hypothetical protein KFW09_01710 [Oscillospiraceae bacterium]|nr:hypothetical protein [Oscillospiraceae bacterium]